MPTLSDKTIVTLPEAITRKINRKWMELYVPHVKITNGETSVGDPLALDSANDSFILSMILSVKKDEKPIEVSQDWLESITMIDYNLLLGECNKLREASDKKVVEGKKNS